jgi:peroxiredoxin
LDIEAKIKQLEESSDTEPQLEEIEKLKLEYQEIQSAINSQLGEAVGILGETIDLCKKIKNVSCFHSDNQNNTSSCPICDRNKENLLLAKSKGITEWLDTIVPLSRFTCLFFYRGTWCGNCPLYLSSVNDCMREIRQLGGEVYAVCSQEWQYIDQMKSATQVDYDLLSDNKCLLAKKYSLKITQKSGFAFKVMQKIIRGALKSTDSYDRFHDDGISQPAVLVLDNKGNVIYRWVTPALFKTGFGMFDRVEPVDVLQVVRFYFSQPNLAQSIISYCTQNTAQVFEIVLSDETLKKLFIEHLTSEFNNESMEFVEQVEQFEQLLEKHKKEKQLKKTESTIFNTFIPARAPKELNIPGNMRRAIVSELEHKTILPSSFEDHVYSSARTYVKSMLMTDSFMRFIKKEKFANAAVKVIPDLMSNKIL